MQLALLTETRTSLTSVAAQVLPLLPLVRLRLHEYAPMCRALIEPPYEIVPKEAPLLTTVSALQLTHGASLTMTLTLLTVVAAHVPALLADVSRPSFRLHAYAPTYKALMDPPYELAL